MGVTKAVIPVNGLGTRLLPVTKAVPKEILPVGGKPVAQHVAEEAAAAGIAGLMLITGRGKSVIEDHFDRSPELERALAAAGDMSRLAMIQETLPVVHAVRQGAVAGLGHAVACAEQYVGGEPFAVLLADDLIHPGDPLLRRMIEVRQEYGGSVLALMQVDSDQVSQYGVVAIEPTETDGVVTVTDMVEKPAPADAPSNWIVIGRYVCDPAVFDVLRHTPPGRGNEIQLTDALKTLAQAPATEGGGVRGVQFHGRRFDTGSPQGLLRASVEFACEQPGTAADFVPWLRKYLDGLA